MEGKNTKKIILFCIFFAYFLCGYGQQLERPFIIVKSNERAKILAKIESTGNYASIKDKQRVKPTKQRASSRLW